MLTPNLTVNMEGHLCIGGADTVTLAKTHGTPLYVMDENMIRENCRGYERVISEEYGGRAEKIVLHGNSKTNSELQMAVSHDVGRIVCDNLPELKRLDQIAGAAGKTVSVMLRIKPGIDAHTHDFVKTGQIDSKFGFALETGEAMQAVKAASLYPNLRLVGLHCHIGSQILDTEPFAEAARVMVRLMDQVRSELNITLPELNLGGGPGIRYTEEDDPKQFGEIVRAILSALKGICTELDFPAPFVLFEPGRSIVGGAGLTLYTVMAKKVIPNIRSYVLVDGGMCDNPRYALYHSEYEAMIANKADQPRSERVTIGGKCCESGDLIGEDMPLQSAEEDDILAVLATGAYNYSMASNYNRNPRAEIVMVRDGEARTVVKRETYADIVKNDL